MSFRVIVAGAGVAGLVASNCLQKLGIDHVVVEKHGHVAPAIGAGISMWPHGMRILYQLGCLEQLQKVCVPINRFMCTNESGRLVHDNALYSHVQQNHGASFYPFERRQFLQILYDALPDKSFIKTGVAVQEIEQFADGIQVTLSDGSVERGDMVLGCDGVHSLARTLMWQYAGKVSPGLIAAKEKRSLKTLWKTLVLTAPAIPELGERDLTVSYHNRFTFLVTSQPHAVYFFVIFLRDEPLVWPKRERHSQHEAQALADLVMDKPVNDKILFGEVWRRRYREGVISLEECVMEHWHHGRIVLAGDAVHKVHPNMGLGGNSAIEGVACLMNHLDHALRTTKGSKPSATALNMAFAAYQSDQKQRVKELMGISNMVAKMHTSATRLHTFVANWVLPHLNDASFAAYVGDYIARAPKLNFLPCNGYASGQMPWLYKDEGELVGKDEGGELVGKDRKRAVSEYAIMALAHPAMI
ncbi:hypothetical protein CDD82_6243 [Ophiocordyceps australis]|uniref:FAD-binding domain-containing protein n=1 Tax=Ophiocordyceps australis TaxID=1399860 RepID=A0A2C5YYF8_9HYPO|nr:hypothetical protein CDD82_6243 [Ophiocordyceps australis]